MSEYTDEDWRRLGRAVADRIDRELGEQRKVVAERAGFSAETLSKIVNARGTRPKDATLVSLSRAVGWPDDGLHRILGGEDPTSSLRHASPSEPLYPESAAHYDARISALEPEDVEAIEAVIATYERRRGLRP